MYKRLFLILAGFALLAGCGGGGGGGGSASTAVSTPVYSGSTSQATVTSSNARALSADAYAASRLSSSVSSVAKTVDDGSGNPALLQEVASILEGCVAQAVAAPKSSAKTLAASSQNTVNGYSGSYTISITYDQTLGTFSGTVSYFQYRQSAASATALSGTALFSGTYNQAKGTITSLNLSMSNLTGTDGAKSYSLAGSISTSTGATTKTVTISILLTDNVTGRTYWSKDYTLTLAGSSLTLTGTYYDPVHGYVLITTVTPMSVSSIDDKPTSGTLLFTGSNGTKARLTFTGSGYTVEVDTTGSGTFVVVP